MHTAEDYQNRNINLHVNTNIVSIDPQKKMIADSERNVFPYDALLIASGAESNIPPLLGTDKKNIFALRTIDDALRLKKAAEKTNHAILIGGGLLGLEAAKGLIELGLRVEVVEFFDRLLPRQMDKDGAKNLQAQLEKQGFIFHLGAKVKEISGGNDADGILLENGEHIPSSLILFSAGIKPNVVLAKSIGLAINKAIVVDEHMRTNFPDIFAAGDAAECNGMPGGIWPTAMSQGKCAGSNMTGSGSMYQSVPPSTKLKVAGINLVSTGNIDADNKLKSAVYKNNENYRKIVLENGVIKGFIFLGNIDGVKQCSAAMNNAKHVDSLYYEMQRKDFDFNKLM
jgi:nitrite reductase (NADH) large subunit